MHNKVEEICEMKETLCGWLKAELGKGVECVDTEEAGKATNMLKDLAQAEKDCYKAEYYKTVVEAMKNAEEGPYGYDHWRHADGRFARTGTGHRSGYPQDMKDMRYIDDYLHNPDFKDHMMRMGYSGDSRYGRAYNSYKNARRSYTETRSPEHKREMDEHANEHVLDTVATMKEIWKGADSELKMRMKKELTSLIDDMNM